MAWSHARLGKLTAMAVDQIDRNNVQIVNDACDRVANTYCWQMLAIAEYRNPRRGDTFTAIKQQNIANQQVVQNAEKQIPETTNASNEQGSAPQRRPRSYRLTMSGLASLRQSAERTRPWQWSTGPRTADGKSR